MAAPTPTVRQTPDGIKLKDGYQSLITLSNDPDIALWEKTVQPPGLDGGDPIDQTTMHNVTWRTMAPRALVTMTEHTVVCAYDPVIYTSILAQLNVEQTITITFSDGSTLAFFGFIRLFDFAELEEGTQPEVTVTFTPTSWDNVNKVEAGPALAEVAGT